MTDIFSDLLGPTFEEASDSSAIPACASCYAVITEGTDYKSQEPNQSGKHGYGVKLTLQIKGHTDPRHDGWKTTVWFPLSGRVAYKMQRIVEQCELGEIQQCFDKTHPEYVGDGNRPVFTGLNDDEMWKKIADFYLTGSMTDAAGSTFNCRNGGLVGKTISISIGKPRKDNRDAQIERTGDVNPLKVRAGSEPAAV